MTKRVHSICFYKDKSHYGIVAGEKDIYNPGSNAYCDATRPWGGKLMRRLARLIMSEDEKTGEQPPAELRDSDSGLSAFEMNGKKSADQSNYKEIRGRKGVQNSLIESRAILAAALSSMTDAASITDARGLFIEVNDAFASYHRFEDKGQCPHSLAEYAELFEVSMADKSPAPLNMWAVPRALRGESATNFEYCLRRRDTGESWVGRYSFGPILDSEAMIVGSVVVARDITKEKQAEEAFRKSRRETSLLYRISNAFLTVADEKIFEEVLQAILDAFQTKYGVFGYIGDNGDLIVPTLGRQVWSECRVEGKSVVFPARVWGESVWGKAITRKKSFVSKGPFHTPEGHIPIHSFLTAPLVFNEKTIGLVSLANKEGGFTSEDEQILVRIAASISPILHTRMQRDGKEQERRRAELSLKNRSDQLQLILDTVPATIWFKDGNNRFLRVNRATCEMMGMPATMIEGKPADEVFPHHLAEKYFQDDLEVMNSGRARMGIEEEYVNGRGEVRWVRTDKVPWYDEQGVLAGVLAFAVDITEAKRGEEEREKLREQLSQAQKLESVGRLAGGVAHDFNNMLGVILGYSELALRALDPLQPVCNQLREIRAAAQRSANLVRQLLAFARKQTISPLVLDLNETVESMLKMVRRIIGENIELTWLPGEDLGPVRIDPSQIDQILANLCVNARDAISGFGHISIETGNCLINQDFCLKHPEASPGEYVALSIRDDGCGMGQEILSKLFEPFFTTKEVGKGTGLGLSTVHGIVAQNGGFVTVDSKSGEGTTFKIHLPRTDFANF